MEVRDFLIWYFKVANWKIGRSDLKRLSKYLYLASITVVLSCGFKKSSDRLEAYVANLSCEEVSAIKIERSFKVKITPDDLYVIDDKREICSIVNELKRIVRAEYVYLPVNTYVDITQIYFIKKDGQTMLKVVVGVLENGIGFVHFYEERTVNEFKHVRNDQFAKYMLDYLSVDQ